MPRSSRQAPPPRESAEEARQVEPAETSSPEEDETPEPPTRRSLLGGIGTIVSRVAKGRSRDVDVAREAPQASPPDASPAPALNAAVPLRDTKPGLRAEVTRDAPATVLGNAALLADADGHRNPLPEGRELRRPGSVDLEFEAPAAASGRVRPISSLGDPVEPLVIDDFVTEPAYDPVIGPELAAARTRVGLSVDELAERTRIRPHVIESIEVDDFAPCGGDFYARGHLRTLARVLGKDPAPLLAQFDERYATAPINARRVFEAELATGMTGSMRSTIGGPNWSLLIGVVLVLVMTWGVVRLFASEPQEQLRSPVPALNGSAGVHRGFTETSAPAPVIAQTPKPVGVTLVGAQGDSRVVVRDRAGRVVWAGQIVLGEKRTVQATPPVRVQARHGSAISVQVNGKDRGPVGELDEPARRTLHRHR
jgi:cytoskeleton protein RodZ